MTDFENKVTYLVTRFEDKVGRSATPQESEGIARAVNDAETRPVTASLALGLILDINTDWPLNYLRAAGEAYGLDAVIPK